jgi:transcriptional antiterminator RfaH
MSARWYVVQTHAHSEAKAAGHLTRQGFGAYLPRYLKRRRHARRVETVAAPLFPSYLFVAVDMMCQRWRVIHSTIGVTRLVCNGNEPASVPDVVVDALKRRENDEGFVQLERRRFEPGTLVQITDGAFASCLGLFEGMRDDERATVLLDLLGRKVRVLIDELSLSTA